MGTWGSALFSDDTACDVRESWRDLVADGKTGVQATDELLEQYGEVADDAHEGPVFWLALAKTQWEAGRLEDRVRDRAVRIIRDGSDLKNWTEEPKHIKQREAVLEKLRAHLLSPQPAEKRIRKPYQDTCPWDLGEILAYEVAPRRYVLLHVLHAGGSPLFQVGDWIGGEIPPQTEIRRLFARRAKRWRISYPYQVVRSRETQLPADRIIRLGISRKPRKREFEWTGFASWKEFENVLKEVFGLVPVTPATRLSHDLGLIGHHWAIWDSPVKVNKAEAAEIFAAHVRKDRDRRRFKVTPALRQFVEELKARYPYRRGSDPKLSPWRGDFRAAEGLIIIRLHDLRMEEVRRPVIRLAARHGLVFYDPQVPKVILPPKLRSGR